MPDDAVDRLARVANIERVMEMLEALSGAAHGLTVTELSARLGIPKSVVSRILTTLDREGYVSRNPLSNRFQISLKLVAVVLRYVDQLGIEDLCGPILRQFAEETGELVQLALIDGDDMRYVARAEAKNRVRVISILGTRVVPHAFAAGKVWLASMALEQALQFAAAQGLKPLTKRTIASLKALQDELDLVRKRGFAVNLEEVDEGVCSIAAPVRSQHNDGAIVGAVTLTLPAFRLSKARIPEYGAQLKEVGLRLGEILETIPGIVSMARRAAG